VSHMGRVEFKGRDARTFLERMCTRRVNDMTAGQCRYSLVCNERGGVRDDVLIYRMGEEKFMLVVNASNRAKLLDHFRSHQGDLKFDMTDRTEKTAMLALQGPRVMEIIGRFSDDIPQLKKYRFTDVGFMMLKATVSRTGYTGEDGVEVIIPANISALAVKTMMKEGGDAKDVIRPIGLGARDTLRLEAGMPLYGHEMDEETDPISAGLMFGINLDKHEGEYGERFVGQDALEKIHAAGPNNSLVGLVFDTKRTARQGMPVLVRDQVVGRVTSGCISPTLNQSIAMAYVPTAIAKSEGETLEVDLGKQRIAATITPLPFYKRPKGK